MLYSQYSPRHANHAKALGNWDRKSQYLMQELVKFNAYEKVLVAAREGKERLAREKAAAAAAATAVGDAADHMDEE